VVTKSEPNSNKQQSLFETEWRKDYLIGLQNKFRQDFMDLLKEWGATDEWLADVNDFIQNSLFDL
jgi:hypothetical protein